MEGTVTISLKDYNKLLEYKDIGCEIRNNSNKYKSLIKLCKDYPSAKTPFINLTDVLNFLTGTNGIMIDDVGTPAERIRL